MSETMLTKIVMERQMSPLQADIASLVRNIAALPNGMDADAFDYRKDILINIGTSIAERVGELERNLTFPTPTPKGQKPTLYLAAPYSNPDPGVRASRAREASRAAATLMRQGYPVISPLSMGHAIAGHGVDGGFATWQTICLRLLDAADALVVLAIDGMRRSRGVCAEYAHAKRRGLPVSSLVPMGKAYVCNRTVNIVFPPDVWCAAATPGSAA